MAEFHVTLSVTTSIALEGGLLAVANQRNICAPGVFWDIRVVGGFVFVEADDIANYAAITSPGPRVDDGNPHNVRMQRTSGALSVYVDDVASGTTPSTASFGKLPPLVIGTDVCIPQDGTMAFPGTIADLCVASP